MPAAHGHVTAPWIGVSISVGEGDVAIGVDEVGLMKVVQMASASPGDGFVKLIGVMGLNCRNWKLRRSSMLDVKSMSDLRRCHESRVKLSKMPRK